MKICKSPANTSCMYQRIARDEGLNEPVDPDRVQKAYADLYAHLGDDIEGQSLLKELMNLMTGDAVSAMDEPAPFAGRPTPGGKPLASDSATARRGRVAAAAAFAKNSRAHRAFALWGNVTCLLPNKK